MDFHFGEIRVLLLLLIIPVIIYLYILYNKKRKKSALKFSSVGAIRKISHGNNLRLHLPFILLLIAIILIIIGLADPRMPIKTAKEV